MSHHRRNHSFQIIKSIGARDGWIRLPKIGGFPSTLTLDLTTVSYLTCYSVISIVSGDVKAWPKAYVLYLSCNIQVQCDILYKSPSCVRHGDTRLWRSIRKNFPSIIQKIR